MSRIGYIAVTLLSVLSPAWHAEGRARAGGPVTLETLRQRVARNEALIDPIKLSYTVKFTRTGELPELGGGRGRGRSLSHFNITWAQNGSKQYVDSRSFYGPNEPARSELTILDGKTQTRVDLPDKMRASIGSASRTDWYHILTAKLRLRPFEDHRLLSEVLAPPRAVLREGTQTIGNRLVHVVDVTQLYPYSCLRLWIDPEAGIPLRACAYDQHPTVPQALPIVEVNDITPHQLPNGGWIPVTGVRAFHLRRGDTTYNSYERICVDVNSIVTESDDVPESLFWADLPDGASIYDVLSGMTTVKGQSLKTYEQFVQGNGRFIAGTVTDVNGVPVAGVVVVRSGIETVQSDGRPGLDRLVQPHERISPTTDAKGRFALEVEHEGNHRLVFYHEDFVDRQVRGVSPDEHDLKVTLEGGGTITGRVFGVIDGKENPLADVQVFLRAGDSVVNRSMRPHRTMPTTDAQGRFEVRGLPTRMRDRSVASSEPPRYVPLSWRVSCGAASQSITFDRDGQTRAVELVLKPDVRMAASLVGRPMPDLNGLGLDIGREQLKNHRVLVCFFDMEQRPARNCVEELSRRTASLEDRGVTVLAVHEKGIDVDKLQTWAKESAVTFPVGIIAADPDEVKFAWSVRSLPWLILTDAEHIVVSQGFSIEELDEKIAGVAQVTPEDVVTQCTIRDPNNRLLANACVTVYPMGREYRTDDEGRVFIRYRRPKDPEGLHACVRHKSPAWLRTIRLPSASGEVEVRLAEALSVCGRVTDPQGNPAKGVQVAALPMSNRYVRTDANGCFDIAWAPSWAGGMRNLCLMARDAERNLAALVGITPETRSVDLVLEPGLTLAGTVEDPNAKPIAHATVGLSLVRGWGCGTPVEPVESDSRGRWQITALPQRQEYHVSARVRGCGPGKATSGRINTTGDVARVDPIILKPRNRSVSGVVIDVNGLPVEGARVVVDGAGQPNQQTTTDHQGRFTMSEICDGTFALYAARDRDRHRESSGQIPDVQPGRTSREIVMFPERKRQAAREESPFELDPQVGILRYRWSDRGWRLLEGKDWQRIPMGMDRPLGVELANPGRGAPLWGKWRSPAVRGGSRWIVLVRAHARGQYDRLIMDTDGNGRLDDETVVAACASSQHSEHNYLTAFGPIEVILDQSSGPPVIHLSFGFYGNDRELCVGSVGWYEGDVSVAGEKMRCLLADRNADGTFATRSSDLALADLMGLGDAERRRAHVLGKYVVVGDGFYEVRIAEGREHVRVDFARAAGLSCGLIRVPEGITELTVAGENGCFKLCPSEGVVRLPAGTYQIIRWRAEQVDLQGRRWMLTGHSFDDSARVEVAVDGETSLTVGEPVLTSLEQVGGTASPYSFHGPKLTGRLGETVDLDCDAASPGLSLRIRADDRSYDRTFTFAYG